MSNNVYTALAISDMLKADTEIRIEYKEPVDMQDLVGQVLKHTRSLWSDENTTSGLFTAEVLKFLMANTKPSSVSICHVEFHTWNISTGWYPVLVFDKWDGGLTVQVVTPENSPIHLHPANWESDDEEWLDEIIQPHSNRGITWKYCRCDDCLSRIKDDAIDNAIDERRLRYEEE